DPGHHQTVGGQRHLRVGGHLDVGADPLQRPLRRPQVPRAVVQDGDRLPLGTRGHRAPLVDGTPLTRGSGSTACRSARATALYCASVMWCGSRPYSVRTCSAIRALNASDSNTCRLITVWYGAADPAMVNSTMYSGSPVCTKYGRPDRSTAACASASSIGMNASPNRRMPFLSRSACPSA